MNAEVEYIKPTVSLTYVSAAVAAYIDYEGWDKRLVDSLLVPDLRRMLFEKNLFDAFGVLDARTTQFAKNVFDSVALQDVVLVVKEFLRLFSDSTPALDADAFDLSKVLPADSVYASSQVSLNLQKYFVDAFAMADSAAVGDGSTWVYTKHLINFVATADSTYFAVSRSAADTVLVASAGSLVAQNYCDITYFAEDYVGESRVFT